MTTGAYARMSEGNNPANRLKTIQATIEGLDTTKVYSPQEADYIRGEIIRRTLDHVRDKSVWLCVLSVRKTSYCREPMDRFNSDQLKKVRFADVNDMVKWVISLLIAMGYEMDRSSDWEQKLNGYSLESLLPDTEHLVYLLLAECDWERSIRASFDPTQKDKAKYIVSSAQEIFTPAAQQKQYRALQAEDVVRNNSPEPMEDDCNALDAVRQLQDDIKMELQSDLQRTVREQVQKAFESSISRVRAQSIDFAQRKLDFEDVEDSSLGGSPNHNTQLLVDGLIRDVKSGKIDKEEFASSFAALVGKSPPKSLFKASAIKRKSSQDEYLVDDDDDSEAEQRSGHGAVIQNVTLTHFNCTEPNAEEARFWLSKFLHHVSLAKMTKKQKMATFALYLGKAARNWYRQLDDRIKKSWPRTLDAFKVSWCEAAENHGRKYYNMRQDADESALNYLYRLNVAAKQIGLDYLSDESELEEHLDVFCDSLIDKEFADKLRVKEFSSVERLEKWLKKWERKHPKKKTPQPPRAPPRQPAPPTPPRSVSFTDAPARQPPNQSPAVPNAPSGRENLVCNHCKKTGHTQDTCFKLRVCFFCKKNGHLARDCVARARQIVERAQKFSEGKRSAEEFKQDLN